MCVCVCTRLILSMNYVRGKTGSFHNGPAHLAVPPIVSTRKRCNTGHKTLIALMPLNATLCSNDNTDARTVSVSVERATVTAARLSLS